MNDTARVYFDLGYLSEENKMLRDELKHWKLMYENLKKEYEDAVNKYDQLVMETVTRDLQQHWKLMYENLKKEYEDAVNKYDQLVMETVTRDLQQLGEI
jgi:predicted  nucleic acid-binding Zn-ribbon protein